MNSNRDEKAVEIFERMPVPKALFTMALPTIAGQLIVLIYSIADTFFIGQTNNPNMVAAVSLLLPVYNLTGPLANMTGVGGGTVMSMLIARENSDEAKKICAFSFYVCIVLAFIFSLILLIFNNKILYGLGATIETYRYARIYSIIVISLGAIPISLSNTMSNLVRSCGFSKEAGFGVMLGGILNIILDPLFMFVIFEKGREVEGAAIATLLSNIISMIYFFVIIYKIKDKSSMSFDIRKGLPQNRYIKKLFSIGIPGSVTPLFFDIDYMILDKLMSAYGAVNLAALGIVLKAERLPLNTGVGICLAMCPMVAYNMAAKNKKRSVSIIRLSLISGLVVGLVSFVLYQTFTGEIIRFFIDDVATIEAGKTFLKYRSYAASFMFTSFFFSYLFQAFDEGMYSMMLGLVRWCGLNIPLLFIFNYFFQKTGLVCAQFVADFTMAILSLIFYFRYKKKHII